MAEQRKQGSRLWLWLGVVALLVAVFFTAHYMLRGQLPVREAQAAYQDLSKTVSTNGTVEPEKTYSFFSPISTTVKAVYVEEGDHVAAGKLLIQLDDTEALAKVAGAESALEQAQVGLNSILHNGTQVERQTARAQVANYRLEQTQAQNDLNALEKLVSTGAASPSEVAAAKQRLAAATGALHAAEQNMNDRYAPGDVSQARAAVADAQASLKAAKQTLAQTQIRAPIAGTVYDVEEKETDFVEAGHLLLQMADLREERVRAYFDEPEIGALAVGQPVSITWDAKPGQEWHGHVERTPITVVRQTTRTVGIALIHIDNAADSGLLPDTNVTVNVTTAMVPHALTVPREAVYPESGHPVVYKIVDGKLVRTPVTTGMFNVNQEQIVSGLSAGDWVATGSPSGQPLQDGTEVRIVQ
ncbi:MAG TPA: efflux RND transporter periplasmic adaptor subunit [Terracidiphilus sp.]|nr:efflux RND transporter periplasmic adaptor subunit [Terracidiphilus sp.]